MSSVVGKRIKKSPKTPDVNQNDRLDSTQTQRRDIVKNVKTVKIVKIILDICLSGFKDIFVKFSPFQDSWRS